MPCPGASRSPRSACGKPAARSPPTPPPRRSEADTPDATLPAVTLRESFTAINSRFHLVGVYTLVELFLRFAVHWSRDDPAGLPLVLAALILFFATYCGILGMVYQAAAGRTVHAAVRWALALFLPLVWL